MNGEVSFQELALAAILVLIAASLALRQRLGVTRDLIEAAVRAAVQLLLVGAALTIVIANHAPLWPAVLWVIAMVIVAGTVAHRRAPEVPSLLPVAALAIGASVLIALGVVFGLGILPLRGRTLVPLAGMVVGNAMSATVLCARRFVDELQSGRPQIEARLALGMSSTQAARPHARRAVRAALTPQIETTKTVGIIALPGAMTGLILAGVDPAAAVRVQLVVMYLILASVTTTTTVVSLALVRRMFTADDRLRALPPPAAEH